MHGDRYLTIEAPVRVEIPRIRGSRFIADAFPIASEEEARQCIDAVRAREPSATHHCYAYRLGVQGEVYRYSDDGEPSGTAGLPILRQIEARNLTGTLVVVTRYFGGTKLGTGGLVRAYGEAAGAALDRAHPVERVLQQPLEVRFAYDDTAAVMRLLHRFQAEVLDSHYDASTTLCIQVPRAQTEAFLQAFTDALSGRGTIRLLPLRDA